ncbi:MAG TPA: ABC transporter substrate-binding protein [Candidatus Limnocylindrales bacterium]|nr:ABC transporter substrate-binding protein [Candidatus Limnocylindrales bacterium]
MADERTRHVEAILGRRLTRREVLILAAYGGSAAAAAAFIAACSPAASPSASGAASAAAPSAAASAPASAAATMATGRTIKIGFVTPSTGAFSAFAESDEFVLGAVKQAIDPGIVNGDTTYPIQILVKDSQSDPNRAAEVAGELILDDGIDLMVVSNTPETTNPVADQCEANGVPCISSVTPWQPYFLGRQPGVAADQTKPFDWTYHFFWGLEDVISVFLDIWSKVETNKVVGGLFPNDGDGNAWGDPTVGFPTPLKDAGYTLIDPGRYENLSTDFSAQINAFKQANVEILTGVPLPPDFTTFWQQAAQQGFKPKIATMGKALLFPSSVEALGDLGENLTSEVWWSPVHPFTSSLTDQSAQQMADAYTASTAKQWTQPIGFAHAVFEVAADVLTRATSIDDKAAIRDAIKATALDTVVGHVQWDGTGLPPFAATNIAKTPLVGGQWKKGTTFPYDLVIVSNKDHTDIPAAGTMEALPG